MRPRFSIRTLLVLTALAAAACYWWIVRPTVLANRFVAAVNSGTDFAAANAMFPREEVSLTACVVDWSFNLAKMGFDTRSRKVALSAYVVPRTWDDMIRGQRHIHVDAMSGLQTSWEYVATRRYIKNATFGTYQLPPGLPSTAAAVDNQ